MTKQTTKIILGAGLTACAVTLGAALVVPRVQASDAASVARVDVATRSPAALPAAAKKEIDRTFAAYEKIRKLLADDRGAGVPAAARAVAKHARAAAPAAPAPSKGHLSKIASAADALAKTSESDLEKLRKRFGEVSRQLVALVAAEPSLAKGRHVFYCPMAKGYHKWIQPTADLANPYMGKRMLKCGSKTNWQ